MTKPKRFLTADPHYKHFNCLRLCNRPFTTLLEMEDALIANWNSVVGDGDIVYSLGDICFHGEKHKDFYISLNQRLNGRHILILGNHDVMKPFKYVECGFESVHTSLIVDDIFLIHDATKENCIPKDMMCFCGHSHGRFKKVEDEGHKVLNVGCDIWGYTPIEWDVALQWLKYGVADKDMTLRLAGDLREKGLVEQREKNKSDASFTERFCNRTCSHMSISKRTEGFYCFKYYKHLIQEEPECFDTTKVYRTKKCVKREKKNGETC